MKQQLIAFYLDWCNNFVSVSRMAEHYGLTTKEVVILTELGKKYHEEEVLRKRKDKKQGA